MDRTVRVEPNKSINKRCEEPMEQARLGRGTLEEDSISVVEISDICVYSFLLNQC